MPRSGHGCMVLMLLRATARDLAVNYMMLARYMDQFASAHIAGRAL
jgi:hypothetical protein